MYLFVDDDYDLSGQMYFLSDVDVDGIVRID